MRRQRRSQASLQILLATIPQLLMSQAMAQPVCDPLKVALEYIAMRYPSFDASGLKRVISERDGFWEITYELPEDMLGGVPVITIDRRTCSIVRATHTQ
jgi:hypothetical protein